MREALQQYAHVRNASELLRLASLNSAPINLDELVRILDVEVSHEFDFDRMGYSGRISWTEARDTAEIWINPMDGEKRQRFTLSHELGHLFRHMIPDYENVELAEGFSDKPFQFHRDGTTSSVESEANKFAAELLMPSHLVRHHASELADEHRNSNGKIGISRETFITRMADAFDVSSQAMEIRLKNLRII